MVFNRKIVIAKVNNICSALKGKDKYSSVAFKVHLAALKTYIYMQGVLFFQCVTGSSMLGPNAFTAWSPLSLTHPAKLLPTQRAVTQPVARPSSALGSQWKIFTARFVFGFSCFCLLFCLSFFRSKLSIPSASRFAGNDKFYVLFRRISFLSYFLERGCGRERARCDFRCNKIESKSESTLKALWPSPPSIRLSPTEIRHFMVTALFFILCTLLPPAPAPLLTILVSVGHLVCVPDNQLYWARSPVTVGISGLQNITIKY